MPAIGNAPGKIAAAPTRPRRPAPRRPVAPVPSGDQVDRNRAVRQQQLQRSVSLSPDASDRNKRSPAQEKIDKGAVDHAVRTSRLKVVGDRGFPGPAKIVKAVGKSIAGAAQLGSGAAAPGTRVRTPKSQGELERLRRHGAAVVSPQEAASLAYPGLGTPARVTLGVGEAFAEKPGKTTVATLKGARDMLIGAPAGIVKTVVDPKGTVKSIVADYRRRYGDVNSPGGVQRLKQRVEKEGAASYIADAVGVGVPLGKVADAALGAAARSGRLGAALREATTAERPALRTSGGGAAAQPRGRGLSTAVRQTRRDRNARRTVQRTVDRADAQAAAEAVKKTEGAPKGEAPLTDVRRPRGPVDAVVREAANRGEVVPTRLGGRVISHRKIAKAQRHGYALAKGRELHQEHARQRTELGARGSGRALASLNLKERRAFKTAMQAGNPASPEAGVRAVRARIDLITAARAAGHDVGTEGDELPTLRRILQNPRAHFTPRLQRVVQGEIERGGRVGVSDPGLGATPTERALNAEGRRLAPQAELQGVVRQGTPIREARQAARAGTRSAKAARGRAGAGVERAVRKTSLEEGRARLLVEQANGRDATQIARAERAVQIHERAAANHRGRAVRARQDGTRASYQHAALAAEERADRAKARLDEFTGRAGTRPHAALRRLQAAVGNERLARVTRDRARAGVGDARQVERDLKAAQRAGHELDPRTAEPVTDFRARVRAARPEGIGEPGYFPSRKRERVRFSPFTIGGARRVKPDRRYRGRLFAAGRESNSLTEYNQALAQNIKRASNWKLITDTIRTHAIRGLTGVKYNEALDRAARAGIDPQSVRFVDMDAFDRQLHDLAQAEGSGVHLGVSQADKDLHAALKAAVVDTNDGARLEGSAGRLVALPRAVADEMLADTKPSGALGRSLDILKGKQARILLGLSPAWLQFQVAANALQTAVATKALPHEWIIANVKWWRGLSPAEKRTLEPYVGIGAFHDSVDTPRIGAAAEGGLVNAYRAFKAHPFWHTPRKPLRGAAVSQLNPLDVLFRLDNAQNNFFRRAVLYNDLKKQAYARMGANVRVMQQVQDKFLGAGTKDAEALVKQMVNDKPALEHAAAAVRDFLGDYATKTAKERRWLDRNVMFYGYLRFSLRFAFYTMPIKHPVMTAILGQLGRLNTEDVRKLLGGDQLPYSLGKLYFTRGGKLSAIDLSRANPALNSLTQALATRAGDKGVIRSTLQAALQNLPPLFVTAIDLATAKSTFKDKALKVDTESSARPNKQGQSINDRQAVEYAVASLLRLAAPYRAAETVTAGGRPLSDNSLLVKIGGFGGQKYTNYRDPKIRFDVARAQGAETTGQRIRDQFLPFVPRPSQDPQLAARIRRGQGVASPAKVRPQDAAAAAETQRLIETYGGQAAAQQQDPAEMQRLVDTYGG